LIITYKNPAIGNKVIRTAIIGKIMPRFGFLTYKKRQRIASKKPKIPSHIEKKASVDAS
jgi:hypothetical protein